MGKELASEAATNTNTRKKSTFPPGYVSDDMDIADEELGVENGMGRKGVPPSAPRPRAPFSTSEVRGLPVSISGSEVAPVYPDTDRAKPRSAQTVLNTSGAVWNLKRVLGENTSDGGGWDGRLAKRAKVTDTGSGRGDLSRVVSRSGPCKTPQSYDDVILRVDLDSLRVRYEDLGARSHLTSSLVKIRSQNGAAQRNDVAIENANLVSAPSDEIASAALSRIISKGDFMHMDVVGQFNLGFIIVRKRTPEVDTDKAVAEISVEDDLFVVDQHAADEKWNFETLQETTAIESQRLFRPRPLNLTAADELVALENMDVLKRNGFEVGPVEVSTGVDHQAGAADIEYEEEESSPNARLHLMAQPISKDTVFDMKDLEELIHLMQDRPRGTMVRCSKARAMFAMRACRRSVMIGRPLDKSRMTTIVRHMASMDQPWNCPHGRPTMRHLSDLTSFGRYDPPSRTVNWQEFGAE
ncbi:hypothetical protein BKA82DRAFT_1005195 [Pisolithus tinctorius]|nr:hypothetical protein BKA82DRAFT_1005195 [Pisolithus tinctorius]